MRRTSLWILALSLVAGACDSESGPSVAKLEDMRVVKVSGDQSSPVPSAPSTTIYATAGASLQALPGDGYTPEPLVARVVVEGSGSMGIMSSGPVVPAGTMIHWDLPEVAGKLRGLTTATDDSAHIVNRWAPGTKAGTYVASAHRILADGTITDDAEWELVVEPGAVAQAWFKGRGWTCVGRQIDAREYLSHGVDAHQNPVPNEQILATPDSVVQWRWKEGTQSGVGSGPEGTGWTIPVPDFGAHGYKRRTAKYVPPDPDRDYYSAEISLRFGGGPWNFVPVSQAFVPEHCAE